MTNNYRHSLAIWLIFSLSVYLIKRSKSTCCKIATWDYNAIFLTKILLTMHTLHKFLRKKTHLFLLLFLFHFLSSFGQTATVNLDWNGSETFNALCVPPSLAFACGNNTGFALGSWNDGSRTFSDPIPAGKILTNISITGFLTDGAGSGAGSLSVVAELNGVAIDVPKTPLYQDCPTITANGTFPSINFSSIVPSLSYNYGLNNTIRFNVTSSTGFNAICLDKAVVF